MFIIYNIFRYAISAGEQWTCSVESYATQFFIIMTSAGVSIALAMQPLLPMADDDDKPTYSKSLTVNPLARILRPMFYGGNGRFVMSWTIVFIFVSSSLVISLSTSQLESFCASGSIKGVSFLISFWGYVHLSW